MEKGRFGLSQRQAFFTEAAVAVATIATFASLTFRKDATLHAQPTPVAYTSPSPIFETTSYQDGPPEVDFTTIGSSEYGEASMGEGEAKIELAYAENTNLHDPIIKQHIEEDMLAVKVIIQQLPILGYPTIALSAQDRYGYDFPAVNRDSLGTFYKERRYMFLNMENTDTMLREHLVLHELGGHYLSVLQNREYLSKFMDPESIQQAEKAEEALLHKIRKYKDIASSDADKILEEKIAAHQQVTLEEIIDASNVYPSDIWNNPQDSLQFSGENAKPEKVAERADRELLAEFVSYLLQAQNAGSFDHAYQHPVLSILASVKKQAK